ncbi:hypothetical protein BN934_02856 [Lacticaseibacillus rhamnosus]|nr:hypothetical protein BN934_02856 [Lacticaseibacillus rhamnosus]
MRRLGTQQVGQDLHGRALALETGSDRLVEGASHALQPQLGHGRHHLMPLHGDLAGCHSGCSRHGEDGAAPDLLA